MTIEGEETREEVGKVFGKKESVDDIFRHFPDFYNEKRTHWRQCLST